MSEKKEKMISIFDPAINAYREVPISAAEKFVDSARKVAKELDKLEGEKDE